MSEPYEGLARIMYEAFRRKAPHIGGTWEEEFNDPDGPAWWQGMLAEAKAAVDAILPRSERHHISVNGAQAGCVLAKDIEALRSRAASLPVVGERRIGERRQGERRAHGAIRGRRNPRTRLNRSDDSQCSDYFGRRNEGLGDRRKSDRRKVGG